MDFLNKKIYVFHFLPCLVPLVFSISAVVTGLFWLYILTVLSAFAVVGLVPSYKRRENLWMFLIVAISGIPVNIVLILGVLDFGLMEHMFLIGRILWCCILYSCLFSIEEILFGIVTRRIWKRQYKLKI